MLSHSRSREFFTLLRTATHTAGDTAARSSFLAPSHLVASLKADRKRATASFSPPSPFSLSSIPWSQRTRRSVRSSAGIRQHHQPGKRVFFTGALFTQVGRHGHCRQKRGRMVLSDSVSFVLSMVVVMVTVMVTVAVTVVVAVAVAVAVTVAVTVAVMFSCSSHGILFAERGLIGGRTRYKGQPLVRSSPRGVFPSRCVHVLRVRQPALLFCCSPRGAFLTSFSASPSPSSAHLSTFNPLARSRSSARPSRS